MKAASGDKIKGFAVAGEDRKFVWANVEIQGDHVLVSSPACRLRLPYDMVGGQSRLQSHQRSRVARFALPNG
jgi:hypothetical protein